MHKERWIDFMWIAGLFAFTFGINEILWRLDIVVLVVAATILVPVKLLVVIRCLWQSSHEVQPRYLFVFLFVALFVAAFLLDFETLPHLWAYRFGEETQGTIVELNIKGKGSRFVTYEFRAKGESVMKEQRVMPQKFESLTIGADVPIKYLGNNPNISFLIDLPYLKFETWINVFAVFSGLIYALYSEAFKNIFSQLQMSARNT